MVALLGPSAVARITTSMPWHPGRAVTASHVLEALATATGIGLEAGR
jgi:hypothetical protein